MKDKIDDKKIMSWEECRRDFIRHVEIDKERIKSIKKTALKRLEMTKEIELNKPISPDNVSFIIEDYYEVIKELLVSYMLKNGMRSKNHQCLISYFYKENPEYEREAFLISQMSFFRNRLDYYGEKVPMDFYTYNKDDFDEIIRILLEIIEKD